MSRGTLAVSLNQCLGSLAFPRAPGRAGGPEVEGPELTLTVTVGRASAKARAGDRLWVMTRTMQDERRLQVVRRLQVRLPGVTTLLGDGPRHRRPGPAYALGPPHRPPGSTPRSAPRALRAPRGPWRLTTAFDFGLGSSRVCIVCADSDKSGHNIWKRF